MSVLIAPISQICQSLFHIALLYSHFFTQPNYYQHTISAMRTQSKSLFLEKGFLKLFYNSAGNLM